MRTKMKSIFFLLVAAILVSLPFTSAITASIGNSRMVLRVGPGENIEKSILVRNINDVPVTIKFAVTGDLSKNVKLKDESFILQPGEEKNALFSIKADNANVTETKINVGFFPEDGNSVGLSSSIVVIADEKYAGAGKLGQDSEIEDEKFSEYNKGDKLGVKTAESAQDFDPTLLIIMGVILTFILMVLLFYFLVNGKRDNVQKNSGREGEKETKPKKRVTRKDA